VRYKLEKREKLTKKKQFIVSVLSLVAALLLMGLIIAIFGESPMEAYKELFTWPFIPDLGMADTFQKMVPLLIIALGLSVVFKMRIWNIGAEGQLFMGAMFTSYGALFLLPETMPSWLSIPLLFVMGFSGGAFWALIPAVLKAYMKVDEILVTLMLNYVAMFWVNHLIFGPWKDPDGYNFPITAMFPKSTWLGTIGDTGVNTGLFIALALVVIIYLLLNRSKWGFQLELLGDNQTAASYAGVSVKKNILLALIVSGGLAGMAGSVQMLGLQHRLQQSFSPGYGFTAIIVAWLAKLNPWIMTLVAFLFGGLMVGSEQLQIIMRMPASMVSILQGLVLICLLAGEAIMRYRIVRIQDSDPEKEAAE